VENFYPENRVLEREYCINFKVSYPTLGPEATHPNCRRNLSEQMAAAESSSVLHHPSPNLAAKQLHFEIKFKAARKEVKLGIKNQMSCNLATVADEYVISKKFWSYFKTTSNSNRIPETVFFIETYGANDQEKVDLFNSYFYEQFSSPS
jgi:hypothetical protein